VDWANVAIVPVDGGHFDLVVMALHLDEWG
jgi:hypothetical protein